MGQVVTAVAIDIAAPVARAFSIATGMDMRRLIRPQGLLPGVAHVEGHDAPWSAPGQERAVTLTDGGALRETLLAITPETSFDLRIDQFKGLLASLADEAFGDWRFTRTGKFASRIDWTYRFEAKSPISEPLLWTIVKLLWPGYMRAALERIRSAAETEDVTQ